MEYVRDWQARAPRGVAAAGENSDEGMAVVRGLRDRYLGALLGLAIAMRWGHPYSTANPALLRR